MAYINYAHIFFVGLYRTHSERSRHDPHPYRYQPSTLTPHFFAAGVTYNLY